MKRTFPLFLLLTLLLIVALPAAAQSGAESQPPLAADTSSDAADPQPPISDPRAAERAWLLAAERARIQEAGWQAYAPDAATVATIGGDWTNGQATACILPLSAAHAFAMSYGLAAPAPFDANARWPEYIANLALKFCAPVLFQPQDISRVYDTYAPDATCGMEFNQPITTGTYKNFLGIPVPTGEVFPGKEWGDFGEPGIYHYNTDVEVNLKLPWAAGKAQVVEGDYTYSLPTKYFLPVGLHDLVWRGDTELNLSDTIPRYFPGWAYNKWAKYKKLKTLTKAQEETSDLVLSFLAGELIPVKIMNTTFNEEIQRVTIKDLEPPQLNADREVVLEAIEPGGLSRRTYLSILKRGLTATDNCDPDPEILPVNVLTLPEFVPVGRTQTVEWYAEDNGPATTLGDKLKSTTKRQTFLVADTLAPIIVSPPDIISEARDLPTPVELGRPGTFDLADLNPRVSHNACSLSGVKCDGGITRFPAGKTTVTWTAVDRAGNRSTATQYVNVKNKGSNRAPTANNGSAEAISYEPVTLTMKASDPDKDRLWFQIEDQPDNGFFHAPLYPYFIDDYRLENVEEIDFGDYCSKEENRGKYVPTNWPVQANFMTVADDGTVYVHDNGIVRCLSHENGTSRGYRVAIFRPDGTWDQQTSSFDVKDMEVNWEHGRIYTSQHGVGGSSSWINVFDLDLNRVARYRTDNIKDPFREPKNAAIDFDRDLLYVTNGFEHIGAATLSMYRLPQPPPGYDPGSTSLSPQYVGDITVPGIKSWLELAVDSQGYLYASDRDTDRIYKWLPASRIGSSDVPGDLIGWMGRCDSGPGCDVANGRSFGYSCSDATCGVTETSGSLPGQFDFPRDIAHDNNDILYVTDYYNQRVQRFTPDGYFAGQAVSECDGSCFVLGDFGYPQKISVNSSHFYVLDRYKDLLHVFETTPITRITDDSAEIVYQSDNNFVGADTFTFRAGDGLANSAPATMTINVQRNHRPPEADGPLAMQTAEDNRVIAPFSGYDPDEALDTLSFVTVDPPQNGRIEREGSMYYYVPDPDFAGTDSFTYAASDGSFTSEPQAVEVTVNPVNDPPRFPEGNAANGFAGNGFAGFVLRPGGSSFNPARLTLLGADGEPLRVGRGFNTVFSITFEDPDHQDVNMVSVDWGDSSGLEAEGKLLDDGTMTGPVLSEGVSGGTGSITAEHIYTNSGSYNVKFCVADNAAVDGNDNKSLTPASKISCKNIPITVTPTVDLLVDIQPSANPYPVGSPLSYDLVITNNPPDSGPGLTASGVVVTDMVDTRLAIKSAGADGGSCTVDGHEVTCKLDPLPPGASRVIHIVTQVPGSIVAGTVLANHVTYRVDQESQVDEQENGDLLPVVHPADFVVNTMADEADSSPGDGTCQTAEGNCSLQAAVQEANTRQGKTTISLADWHFLLEDQLAISRDVTILGLGAGDTIIGSTGEGGLFNVLAGGRLEVRDLTLQGASSPGNGGAVANAGTTLLTRVQVSDNRAVGSGGALWNEGDLTLRDSSVVGNSADGGAGGIANNGTLLLENVTISGNEGIVGGLSSSGQASLRSTTVSDNHASGSGGGISGSAAGISLRNTIVGANTADGTGPDCNGGFTSQGYNLLGNKNGCAVSGQKGSDIVGPAPLLLPPDLNGGSTMGRMPDGASPAVDSGTCDQATDQRGLSRPVDGDLDNNPACDIGAIEFVPLEVMLPLVQR